MYVCMYVCKYVCMYVCVCIHTHTHTQTESERQTHLERQTYFSLYSTHLSVYSQNHLNFQVVTVSHKNSGGQDRPTALLSI